jgi:hypothetical protein
MLLKLHYHCRSIAIGIFLSVGSVFAEGSLLTDFGAGFGMGGTFTGVAIDTAHSSGRLRWMSSVCLDAKVGLNLSKAVRLFVVNKSDFMCPYATIILNNATGIETQWVPVHGYSIALFGGRSYWVYPFNHAMNSFYSGKGFYFTIGAGKKVTSAFGIAAEYQFSTNSVLSDIQQQKLNANGHIYIAVIKYSQTYITNSIRLTMYYDILD